MAKYGNHPLGENDSIDVVKIRMLQSIANELAEANRLKRLEMLIEVESSAVIDADSLEDQV